MLCLWPGIWLDSEVMHFFGSHRISLTQHKFSSVFDAEEYEHVRYYLPGVALMNLFINQVDKRSVPPCIHEVASSNLCYVNSAFVF
jgi:hypothetical protein